MAFNYNQTYYGYTVAAQIRGTIGKKVVYQRVHGYQRKYSYQIPANPQTPLQQKNRNKIKLAVLAWKTLTEEQKKFYRAKEPITPTMSGYNYFIKEYVLAT